MPIRRTRAAQPRKMCETVQQQALPPWLGTAVLHPLLAEFCNCLPRGVGGDSGTGSGSGRVQQGLKGVPEGVPTNLVTSRTIVRARGRGGQIMIMLFLLLHFDKQAIGWWEL